MNSKYPDMSKYPSVQTFKRCLHAKIYSSRRNGFKKDDLVCWLKRGEGSDSCYLDIFRTAPNSYIIHFDSCTGDSWKHRECRLVDVYYAVATWDEFKEEFNKGWFEY